jgi:hypothetical protein
LRTTTEYEKYDQLDTSEWEFFVATRTVLASTELKSLGITRARQLGGGATDWANLPDAIRAAAKGQERDDDADSWPREDLAIGIAALPKLG